jgi:hypothetical protein
MMPKAKRAKVELVALGRRKAEGRPAAATGVKRAASSRTASDSTRKAASGRGPGHPSGGTAETRRVPPQRSRI